MTTTTTADDPVTAQAGVAASPLPLALARQAIARWTLGPLTDSPVAQPGRSSAQARWLAQAQSGLASWIAQGGFAREDARTK